MCLQPGWMSGQLQEMEFLETAVWLIEIADLLAAEVDQRERDTTIG